ncbi:MAG: hypothetical protein U9R27_07310 [Campylobacterota bacterium]|nr:hypothetical protein [Campylobacterota bacterium]
MKKLTLLLMLSMGLLFFAGCGSSNTTGGGEVEVEESLMQAIKSPEADSLAGDQGVYIIFAQSRDGATAVESIEALDTLYLLSAEGVDQTHIYETDRSINVLTDKLVDNVWMETEQYHPADLPDIDLQEAYGSVKAVSGDKPIANIAIFYTLYNHQLRVGFTLQGDATDSCEQYAYIVDTGEVYQTGSEVKCFFEIE